MTVSRVLNGSANGFSEETRQRVIEVVQAMGYMPVAQPATQSRRTLTRTVGLVFDVNPTASPLEAVWGALTYQGLQERARHYGFDLLTVLRDIPEWMLGNKDLKFMDKRCDGYIFITPVNRYETLENLIGHGIPVVACYTSDVPPEVPVIVFDDEYAMRLTTGHLLAKGHQKVMHVTAVPENTYLADRQKGYEETLRAAGLEPITFRLDPKDSISVDQFLEALHGHETTAISAGSDLLALYIHDILEQRGLRVPEDISLTGMDDIPEAAKRGLTTVSADFKDIGSNAFEAFMAVLDGKPIADHRKVFPGQLIERGSVRELS